MSTTHRYNINIFISCPFEDKLLEGIHKELRYVIEEYNDIYNSFGVGIEPLYWEQDRFVQSEKDLTPQEIIYKEIDDYDLYFGMMGSKYGNNLPGKDVSATEDEFNDALNRKDKSLKYKYPRLVCFSFLEAKEKDCEDGEFEKIQDFLCRARKEGFTNKYKSQEEIVKLFRSKLRQCIKMPYLIYQKPENYKIPLYVQKPEDVETLSPYWEPSNLFNIINKGKKIILFGSGGSGKSTYLQYLAFAYSTNIEPDNSHRKKQSEELFIPILFKLSLYKGESITNMIAKETHSKPENIMLLMDGYDELDSRSRNDFHKSIKEWSEMHPDSPIIVSSRPFERKKTPFQNFELYNMSPLNYEQIQSYLKLTTSGRIDIEDIAKSDELFSIIQTPFYLEKVVEYLSTKNDLPTSISEILEFSLKHGERHDDEHFETSFIADFGYKEPILPLYAFAVFTKSSDKSFGTHRHIQKIFKSERAIKLLTSYTGLIEFDEINNSYSFTHKVFQDYLAAKALSKISYPEVKQLIFGKKQEKVPSNWISSIPFLIELLDNPSRQNLIKHILKHQQTLLIEVPPELLNEETKKQVFITTFEHHSKTTKYFPNTIDMRRLAKICDSSFMENYLLDYIKCPNSDEQMIIEAFILLSHSKQVNKSIIDEALIASLLDDRFAKHRDTLNYIVTYLVKIIDFDEHVLDKLYLQNPKATLPLLTHYDSKLKFIDAVIDIYEETGKNNHSSNQGFDTKDAVENYLTHCSKSGKLATVIDKMIVKDFLNYYFHHEDFIKDIISIAINEYQFKAIYESIYQLFVYCLKKHKKDCIKYFITYFIEHGVEYRVVKRIFEETENIGFEAALVLLNQDNDNFVKSVCLELIPSLPHNRQNYVLKCLANSQIRPLYYELLESIGLNLNQHKIESFSKKRRERTIQDMGLILRTDLILAELDSIYGNKTSITYEESRLLGRGLICSAIESQFTDYRAQNRNVQHIPKHIIETHIRENHQSIILNFVKNNFRNNSSAYGLGDELDIKMSSDLREWLEKWKTNLLNTVNIKSARKQIDAIRIESNPQINILWTMIRENVITVNDDHLLDFLSFLLISSDWDIIESKISNKSLVKKRVFDNLKEKDLLPLLALDNHIWFCVKNNYQDVLHHSYSILSNLDKKYYNNLSLKDSCLESIIQLEKNDKRFKKYIKACSTDDLNRIADSLIKNRNHMSGLKPRLKAEIKQNNTENHNKYLYYLCCMNDDKSLPLYIDSIMHDKTFHLRPDYPNPFMGFHHKEHTKILIKLLTFSFDNKINEGRYYRIGHHVLEGIMDLAIQSEENYNTAHTLLTEVSVEYSDNNYNYLVFEYIWKIEDRMCKEIETTTSLNYSKNIYEKLANIM